MQALMFLAGFVFMFLVPVLAFYALAGFAKGLGSLGAWLTSTQSNCLGKSMIAILVGVPLAFLLCRQLANTYGFVLPYKLLQLAFGLSFLPAIIASGGGGPADGGLASAMFMLWGALLAAICTSLLTVACKSRHRISS
jgi:hypothetical protein